MVVSGILISIGIFYNLGQRSFFERLVDKNAEFAKGEELLRAQNYIEAIEHFELALANAEGFKEEGEIKYRIAMSFGLDGEPVQAIKLLKEVAGNENYSKEIRAYSIQRIRTVLNIYNTPIVREEVFKDEPYKSFLSEGDYFLTLRKLSEYAASFYPLGLSEVRVARWYSSEILEISEDGINDAETEEVERLKRIIREKITSAEKYLSSIGEDGRVRLDQSEVEEEIGNVLADLYLAGNKSFGDPEVYYERALISASAPSPEAGVRLSYAIFLTKMYGEDRRENIEDLLNDFSKEEKYTSANIARILENKENLNASYKNNILLLAQTHPEFKEFIKIFGW